MFVAGVVTKSKGISSVLTLSKKKNRTLHLEPQRAGFMVKPNVLKGWLSEIVGTDLR